MRPYEVMVIFDVDLEEGDIRERLERVHELLRAKGGTPGSVNHWGRRTFAYEIKHRSEGYYVVLEATAEPVVMADVDRYLALEDAVLRYKVIRQPEQATGRPSPARSRPAPASAEEGERGGGGGGAPPGSDGGAEAQAQTGPIADDSAETSGDGSADSAAEGS